MIGVTPLLYLGWKFIKKTKIHKSAEVNLVENLREIEDYQANYVPTPARYVLLFDQRFVYFSMLTFVAETALIRRSTGSLAELTEDSRGIGAISLPQAP